MKPALILVLILSLPFTLPIGVTRAQDQASTGYQTIDTEAVKKSIVFLSYPRGEGKYEVGTGFLLVVADKGNTNLGHSHRNGARGVVSG